MDEHGSVYKAEVVRGREVAYHGAPGSTDELEAELLPAHQAEYAGIPFQTVSPAVVTEQAIR